jgi:hypothetical protein
MQCNITGDLVLFADIPIFVIMFLNLWVGKWVITDPWICKQNSFSRVGLAFVDLGLPLRLHRQRSCSIYNLPFRWTSRWNGTLEACLDTSQWSTIFRNYYIIQDESDRWHTSCAETCTHLHAGRDHLADVDVEWKVIVYLAFQKYSVTFCTVFNCIPVKRWR